MIKSPKPQNSATALSIVRVHRAGLCSLDWQVQSFFRQASCRPALQGSHHAARRWAAFVESSPD